MDVINNKKTNRADHNYPIIFMYDISSNAGRFNMSFFSKQIRKKILAQRLDVKPESLRFSINTYGKPILKGESGLLFNVSHTHNYWIMTLSNEGNIGVDIEQHKERRNIDDIVSSYFHSAEQEEYIKNNSDADKIKFFYHIWTRKEAYSKYLGLGLNYEFSSSDLRNVDTSSVTILTALIPRTKKCHCATVSIAHKKMPHKIRVYGNTPLKKLTFS